MPPTISTQPSSQTVAVGQTATFTVAATGTAPFTYQWQKGGVAVSGATSSSYTTPTTTLADNGEQFSVVVSNGTLPNATSSAATLTVNAAGVAPSITTQPSSQAVTVGQSATFTVVATGTSPLSYQWSKNNAAISGATSSSYTTPVTVIGDSGSIFTVIVSNVAGNKTSNTATLTVSAVSVAPSITAQPSSQTVTVGQTATFTVAVTGTAPFTYQWSKGGVAISGVTSSSYTTPATTLADNGTQFTVVVSNVAGNKTSNTATLTVNASNSVPQITGISPSAVVPGHVGFTLTVSGQNFLSNAAIQVNGSNRSTSFANGQLATAMTAADVASSGQLTIKVVNPAPGGGTSNVATLVVNSSVSVAAVYSLKITDPDFQFGTCVKYLGNVTGASGDDAMGITLPEGGSAGVYVVFSPASHPGQFTSSQIGTANLPGVKLIYTGPTGGQFFTIASAGDVDGDGINDILISTQATSDPVNRAIAGTAFLVQGGSWLTGRTTVDLNDSTLPIVRMEGVGATDSAGQSLANVKDFDGDGKADIAFSAPGYNSLRGAVYLIRGHSGFFSQRTINLAQVGAQVDGFIITRSSSPGLASGLGSVSPGSETIAIVGDLNGDGLSDLVIGDTAAQNQTPNTQKTYIVFGNPGLRGTFNVEDIGTTFNGATYFSDRSGSCHQNDNFCYASFGTMVSGRNGSVMIANPITSGGTGGGGITISEQTLTNGQLIDVRVAPQTAQITDLWNFTTSAELMGHRMKDGADFRLISIPYFNQFQGKIAIVAGSHLPMRNDVDITAALKFSILGESPTSQIGFGLDRSSDGSNIFVGSSVGSSGAAYLIPTKNLLF